MKTSYFLCFNSFYCALYIVFLEKVEKKVYSRGVLDRIGQVTVNTTFFFRFIGEQFLYLVVYVA